MDNHTNIAKKKVEQNWMKPQKNCHSPTSVDGG
jgi:hypothetical protein